MWPKYVSYRPGITDMRCTIWCKTGPLCSGHAHHVRVRLHRELGLQALPIARGRGHGEQAIGALVGNAEVPGLEGAVQFGGIPTLRMTHIVDRKVVVLAPKERHGIKLLAKSENVPRGRLSLTFGHDPVLDANPLSGVRIRPPGDVSGRKHPWCAGLQVFVDGHSAVHCQTRLLGERNHRPYSNADDQEIRIDRSTV